MKKSINKGEKAMYQLKGHPPGQPWKPKRCMYIRRQCAYWEAEKANKLYGELGWQERWVKEKGTEDKKLKWN